MVNHLSVPVFPLPGFVAFPGHSHHFHIFEPRYRKMIADCLEQSLELGVALAVKKVRRHSANLGFSQSASDSNSYNQQSYLPANVIGVGPVNIVERFDDGRMVIEVDIQQRMQIIEMHQRVPYLKAECLPLRDLSLNDSIQCEQTQNLLRLSKDILGEEYGVFATYLQREFPIQYDLSQLVYSILKWFRLDPATGQKLLATNLVEERAQILIRRMNQYHCDAKADDLAAPAGNRASSRYDRMVERRGKVIYVDFTSPH